MKRLLMLLGFLLMLTPPPAYASHSMVGGGPDCGTHVFKADLTKGRTNSIVVHVVHTEGCRTYDYTNYVGADREDQMTTRETAWQMGECQRVGKLDTEMLYRYYWDQELTHPVAVTCARYIGPD